MLQKSAVFLWNSYGILLICCHGFILFPQVDSVQFRCSNTPKTPPSPDIQIKWRIRLPDGENHIGIFLHYLKGANAVVKDMSSACLHKQWKSSFYSCEFLCAKKVYCHYSVAIVWSTNQATFCWQNRVTNFNPLRNLHGKIFRTLAKIPGPVDSLNLQNKCKCGCTLRPYFRWLFFLFLSSFGLIMYWHLMVWMH